MRVIDDRGRLFGRINIIDALAILFVVVLVPVGYAAYAVFRLPPPTVTAVEPAVIEATMGTRAQVRIHGTHFMPYLSAYVYPTGRPLGRFLPNRAQSEAIFMIESPTEAVLELPPLAAGTYDLYVYNQAQELAVVRRALTVTPPAPPPLERAEAAVVARFTLPARVADRPRVGDEDRFGSSTVTEGPHATVARISRTSGRGDVVTLMIGLRVPVSRPAGGVWSYKGQRIRAGESIAFGTAEYHIGGVILEIEIPAP